MTANRFRFRAWDKKIKQMFHFADGHLNNEYGLLAFEVQEENYQGIANFPDDADSDNWVIMQSTGLTDKNGKEIFEGDKITYKLTTGEKLSGIVKWHDKYTGFYPFVMYDMDCGKEVDCKTVEVIGNIFENPELLTK